MECSIKKSILNIMIKRVCWSLLISILLVFSCEDDDVVFKGILLRDSNNQSLGTRGSRDLNDWGDDGELPNNVMKLLDFDTETDLTGTEESEVQILGYPNPVSSFFRVHFLLSKSSFVKLIVVNQSMKVLYRTSFIGTGTNLFDIEMNDSKKFPNGKIVRVYYSVSAIDNPNFYVGHGDVLICRRPDDCF